jgi:hypothetical protein
MASLYNLARMTTATTGTGTLTLGSAVPGYLTFALAGVQDGDTVTYAIRDGANSEIGRGVYTTSGLTLTRVVLKSTNSDAAINLSGTAQVGISLAIEDLDDLLDAAKLYTDEKAPVTEVVYTDGTYTRELSPRLELSMDLHAVGGAGSGGGVSGSGSNAACASSGSCPGEGWMHRSWHKRPIEDLTNGNPTLIESTGHGLKTGDVMYYEDVTGTTGMNGNTFTVTYIDADNYSINYNSTSAGAWGGGGTADFRSMPYVIGEGGLGAAAGNNNGADGEDTTVAGGVAAKGLGGPGMAFGTAFGSTSASGIEGGTATGFDINKKGNSAPQGFRLSGSQAIAGDNAPSSTFGRGGLHTAFDGAPGETPGGGGAGTRTITASSRAGGNGGDGWIMFRRNF